MFHPSRWYAAIIAVVIVISVWPMFTGHLINSSMRLPFPNEYSALNDWFASQPVDGRVAELPMPTFWAWNYYTWGYQGAGFIWFGIPQPVLDRDFDRWSGYNEQYFREISYAVYAQNLPLFESVLQKYQVRYLLFDKHVINPGKGVDPKMMYLPEITAMLKQSHHIRLAKVFSKDIAVYTVDLSPTTQGTPNPGFVSAQTVKSQVNPQMTLGYQDWAYQTRSPYITSAQVFEGLPFVQYLFRNFLGLGDMVVTSKLNVSHNNYALSLDQPKIAAPIQIPDYLSQENYLPADVYVKQSVTGVTVKLVYGVPWPHNNANRPASTVLLNAPQIPTGMVLSVDQSTPLPIDRLSDNFTLVGRVTLTTKTPNTIGLYPTQTTTTAYIDPVATPLIPELCGNTDVGQVFGIDQFAGPRALTMYSTNAVACVTVPLQNVLAKTGHNPTDSQCQLVQIDFDYTTKNAAIPYYCLYDVTLQQCAYTSFGNPVQLVTSPNHFYDSVALTPEQLSRYRLRLFLDAVNSHEEKQLTYQNIQFSFYKPSATATVTPIDMKLARQNASFLLQPTNDIRLDGFFPETNRAIVTDITRVKRRPESCTTIVPDAFDRQVKTQGRDRFVEYTAVNGSSCDHFDYPTLTHDRGYIVAIYARNVAGLPLRVCLANNYSKRCDIYTDLSPSLTFAKDYIYLPPDTSPGTGFDVNIDNVSIGHLQSINQIKTVEVLPIPAHWLGSLALTKPGIAGTTAQPTIVNQSQPLSFFATATLQTTDQTPILLSFSQAYESGWLLFRMTNGIPILVFGQHVLANNWANGWLVTQPGGEQVSYVIFFWPQLLEFFGFGLLIALVAVIWHKKRRQIVA